MNIIVLGAGLVGSAITADLARESSFQVTSVDRDQQALDRVASMADVRTVQANLREEGRIGKLVADADLVVCAVPGFMGFETLKAIVEAGKDVVDISFFGEDPFALDELAKEKGVTAVVDCGVAPGLSNVIAGYLAEELDRIERYECYVGGLPQVREWPYEYKAVFSPLDVLEEYTRPARFVEYGQEVVRPALSDVEPRTYPGIGTLEAFNTDGLRTLATTMDIPFMKEKTLRYPGHADLMRVFRESGFFEMTPTDVRGQTIRPIDLTSALLFDQWRLQEGETDLTVMEVAIDGEKDGETLRFSYYLLDKFDEESQTTSMARCTGYTCAIVARQVAKGLFTRKGICPPEYVGSTPGCYEDLMTELARRGVVVREAIED